MIPFRAARPNAGCVVGSPTCALLHTTHGRTVSRAGRSRHRTDEWAAARTLHVAVCAARLHRFEVGRSQVTRLLRASKGQVVSFACRRAHRCFCAIVLCGVSVNQGGTARAFFRPWMLSREVQLGRKKALFCLGQVGFLHELGTGVRHPHCLGQALDARTKERRRRHGDNRRAYRFEIRHAEQHRSGC